MKHFIIILTYVLTPAMCWCQYFYKTYPEATGSTFYSIKNIKNRIFTSQVKVCENWDCSNISEFNTNGLSIWNTELKNTDVGSSTLLIIDDILYSGGNYNPGLGKSVINRMTLDGQVIDEHIYSDPMNRISGSLVNFLNYNNKIFFFSGLGYVNDKGRALIYVIDKSMELKQCHVDNIAENSSTWDAYVGSDSLLTCFLMENGFGPPRDRRRIEKYDKDLNLVWTYQPPDSLLILGNDIKIYGTVLENGNIFFTYYKPGWNDRLPNLRCIDTVTKRTVWEFDFQNISSHERSVFRVKQLKNGDILLSGKYATLTTTPRIRDSPWLMCIDHNGNRKWERAFVELRSDGQDKTGVLWDAIELDNGDIMACGFVRDENFKWDPLLIRTDSEGCIDQAQANCPQVQIIDLMSGVVDEIGKPIVSVYPNPASSYININAPENSTYTIYSLDGQKRSEGFADSQEMDISDLSVGFYILQVTDNTGQRYNLKFHKL